MAGGFDALGLMPELIRAVDDLNWYLPTDVQDESLPLILGGGDVMMVAAETGSGMCHAKLNKRSFFNVITISA